MYILLGPFYFFPSGSPQIADMFGVLIFSAYFSVAFFKKTLLIRKSILVLIAAFFSYVALVSLSNSVFNATTKTMLAILFYLYNILMFVFVASYFSSRLNDEFVFSLTRYVVFACLYLQVVLSVVFPAEIGRPTVFFNNPNQLGYFSIAILSIYCLLSCLDRNTTWVSKLMFLCVFLGALYLALLSLSKAAILSVVVVVFYKYWKSPLLWLTTAVTMLWGLSHLSDVELLVKVFDRLSTLGGQGDDSFAGRGYDRIFNHPEYMLWGAGEGLNDRFLSRIQGMEIHSSWGTLLFSYGLVGLMLFLTFLFSIFNKSSLSALVYILPLFLYSVTHQGLRSTFFWIALGFAVVVKKKLQASKYRLGQLAKSENE